LIEKGAPKVVLLIDKGAPLEELKVAYLIEKGAPKVALLIAKGA
jgi:hypothetical protein